MSSRTVEVVLLGVFLSAVVRASAQTTPDYAVQASASVQTNPAQITLSWPGDPQATGYTVYRKARDAGSWGTGTALPASATGYTDANVTVGNAYEYRVDKAASVSGVAFTGQGYLYAGILAPLVDSRGKVILLVDDSFSATLSAELARLQQDLVCDGWTVIRHDVSRSSAVPAIKAIVTADYRADPQNVKALFLFGHIPVPYSGNAAPDGHPDHVGAWPADVYYADMDGVWTDSSVNTTSAYDPRNWNTPGDGKFDQSTLPSDVELQVGRVDLANLPSFSRSETELLRQYLNKDHNFRFKVFEAQPAGVVNDHFGAFNGEAFAGNGYRNFAPLFGAGSTTPIADWTGSLASQSYLWGYGCGPGWYSSAAGVTTTSALATNDPQVVFTMLFGSYFGDWDSQDNLLRAALATPTYTLTSAWAGRPWWQFHHMALGETIGFSARLSQNNSTTYAGGNRTRGVHVSLQGDPTLRLNPVAAPASLQVATNSSGSADLRWAPSAEGVAGYHVYRSAGSRGPFTRLTPAMLTDTHYTDSAPGSNTVYMVRAIKVQLTASGTFFNPSQGILGCLNSSVSATASPRLTLAAAGAGAFLISGTGVPGQVYQIQANDAFPGTNWGTLGSVTADPTGLFQFTDSPKTASRVYRAANP